MIEMIMITNIVLSLIARYIPPITLFNRTQFLTADKLNYFHSNF